MFTTNVLTLAKWCGLTLLTAGGTAMLLTAAAGYDPYVVLACAAACFLGHATALRADRTLDARDDETTCVTLRKCTPPCPDCSPEDTTVSHYPQYQKCKERLAAYALTPTPADIEGPFYKADAPFDGDLAKLRDTMTVFGTVRDSVGRPLPDAVVDVWQADEQGVYDLDGYTLRGKVRTDAHGEYRFSTLHPGFYKISDPGQPDEFRCAHIHIKIWVGDKCMLTTQLYFSGDKYNSTDAWFDPRRILPADGRFDFVVPPAV